MTAGHSVYLNVDLARRPDIAIANIFDALGPFLESPETLRAIFGCHNSLCNSRTDRRAFNSSNFTVIFLFVTLKTC